MDKKKNFIKLQLESCKRRIRYCSIALEENDYAYVIRECQTVVEICSKILLIRFGFVVPQKHNLKNELEEEKDLFSKKFQNEIFFIKKLSTKLRKEREVSLYGDTKSYSAPNELYSLKESENYLNDTKKFYNLCYDELKDFIKE